MKVKKSVLKVLGVLAGVGLCGSLYVILEHRRKDKLAATLLEELSKLFNPDTAGLAGEEAFDIHYADEVVKKVNNVLIMKADAAQRLAKEIYSAWSWANDNEDRIYNVFRSLKDKVQVSQVARAYKDAYKVNLIEVFRSKLSDNEIGQVLRIVNGLPRYRVV
jgi:hypothetical protein